MCMIHRLQEHMPDFVSHDPAEHSADDVCLRGRRPLAKWPLLPGQRIHKRDCGRLPKVHDGRNLTVANLGRSEHVQRTALRMSPSLDYEEDDRNSTVIMVPRQTNVIPCPNTGRFTFERFEHTYVRVRSIADSHVDRSKRRRRDTWNLYRREHCANADSHARSANFWHHTRTVRMPAHARKIQFGDRD